MTSSDTVQFKAPVGVVIKALNEEKHVERALQSAIEAVRPYNGIVVLADSGSTDRTIEISKNFPVRIVQLARSAERCCGIGAQLGYQFMDCEYIYVLDGDMELNAAFLPVAIERLRSEQCLAGVAGLVEELGGGNYEFESRKAQGDGRVIGDQKALDMGGLYRSAAIRDVQYLTNRNLHSYEEKELGCRLLLAGYRLERMNYPSVRHFGKTDASLPLLWKRWTSHHIDGPGEWMRAAIGTPVFFQIALMFKQLWIIVLCWMAVLFGVLLLSVTSAVFLGAIAIHLLLVLGLVVKKRSIMQGLSAFIHLQFFAAGLLRGLGHRQRAATEKIEAVVLK